MYGTIAKFTLKPGSARQFQEIAQRQDQTAIAGHVESRVYASSEKPDECWLVVAFESKDAYERNAADPAQHERYLELARFFAAEPEWHDGEVIYRTLPR